MQGKVQLAFLLTLLLLEPLPFLDCLLEVFLRLLPLLSELGELAAVLVRVGLIPRSFSLVQGLLLPLELEVVLQLLEFKLDLVFSVLADHLNRPQSLLGLLQLVLFLLRRTPLLLDFNALVHAAAVPLPHLLGRTPRPGRVQEAGFSKRVSRTAP